MLCNNKGFTLAELLKIVIIIMVIVLGGFVFLFKTIIKGNFWLTENGVLRELKTDYPQVTEVLKITRNVFDDSIIVVKENNETKTYYLDSDVLFNYVFSDHKKK